MEFISLECPHCHASLEVAPGRDTYFCSYCGSQVLLDRGGTRHTYVDEASVREAEAKERVRLKELELEKERLEHFHRMEREKREAERREDRNDALKKWFWILLIVGAVIAITVNYGLRWLLILLAIPVILVVLLFLGIFPF